MWREWLNFSRAERHGVVVLLLLLALIIIAPYLSVFKRNSILQTVETDYFHKVDSFILTLKETNQKIGDYYAKAEERFETKRAIQYFTFDPNTISVQQLVQLGFSNKQAKVIENYRKKGGFFHVPSDFQKLYIIDSALYQQLKPYIKIQKKTTVSSPLLANKTDSVITYKKTKNIALIELNSADTTALMRLRGIGPTYAKRIVSYRNLLGGFTCASQLAEIYGITKGTIDPIMDNLWVDTLQIKKIDLNSANIKSLQRHPYLNDYQAKSIMYYQKTMGSFASIHDLVQNKLVDSLTFSKIKPYITVN